MNERLQFKNFKCLAEWISAREEEYTALTAAELERQEGLSHGEALFRAMNADPTEYVLECLKKNHYDLDDLTENGDSYEIGGHSNDALYGRGDLDAAQKILALRHKYGLTQKAMAEKTGIPKRTIENWEQGKTYPKDYIVNLISKFLESLRSGC